MLDKITYLNLLLTHRRTSERGATATEYGLLVAFIAFGIIVAVTAFGTDLSTFFGRLSTEVRSWNPGGGGGATP